MKTFLISLLMAAPLLAADFGNLYDDAFLKKWQPNFQEDLDGIFREDLAKFFTATEKERLRNVRIEVPLRGKQREVFEFYAAGMTVTMPALSLRFFGDLCLASAWLNEKKYNLETVQQYVGMIHYGPASYFEKGRYPRPLDVLQIPDNARDDAKVKDIFSRTFTSGMVFVLGHELGHIYHRHPGYNGVLSAAARANEAEADRFAIELMRRAGFVPAGAALWFTCAAAVEQHKGDFASEELWQQYLRDRTHPLTADRIEALADAIEKAARDFASVQTDPQRSRLAVQTIAVNVRAIAGYLKDGGVHRLFREQSRTTEPHMLAPRRTTTYSVSGAGETFSDEPFSGVFDCTFNSKVSGQSIDMRVLLRRSGRIVKGQYSYGASAGTLEGVVRDFALDFDWAEGGLTGKGRFEWKNNKTFIGTWGSRSSRDDGGSWNGRRE